MRGYNAYHGTFMNNNYIPNGNQACWAGIGSFYKYFGLIHKTNEENTIYINNFRLKETKKYIPLLIKYINKITPCSLETINNVEYIKFQLLGTYDQSLILLNFIRNLWYSPDVTYDYYNGKKEFGTDKKFYFNYFFENLKKSKYREAFKRLTYANKRASELIKCYSSLGHSNLGNGEKLKVKTIPELLEYKGDNISNFLIK